MTEATAPIRARAASAGWLAKLEGRISWILLGLVGLLLPLLDDSYIGVIAQRAYIYWILSAGRPTITPNTPPMTAAANSAR